MFQAFIFLFSLKSYQQDYRWCMFSISIKNRVIFKLFEMFGLNATCLLLVLCALQISPSAKGFFFTNVFGFFWKDIFSYYMGLTYMGMIICILYCMNNMVWRRSYHVFHFIILYWTWIRILYYDKIHIIQKSIIRWKKCVS